MLGKKLERMAREQERRQRRLARLSAAVSAAAEEGEVRGGRGVAAGAGREGPLSAAVTAVPAGPEVGGASVSCGTAGGAKLPEGPPGC